MKGTCKTGHFLFQERWARPPFLFPLTFSSFDPLDTADASRMAFHFTDLRERRVAIETGLDYNTWTRNCAFNVRALDGDE